MTMKKDAKLKPRKKLTLSKETIRDLTPKKGKAAVVRGGGRNLSRGLSNCASLCEPRCIE